MDRDICQTILERISQDFDAECHLTEAEARETTDLIESLRAQLDETRKALEKIRDGYGPDHFSTFCRFIATEALAGREALEKESKE
jgi:hypothetical protein